MSDNRSDRRAFLKALGISVPAALVPDQAAIDPPRDGLSPSEVFEIYVAESLRLLPMHGLSTDNGSVLRTLIEVQGAALALVLAELQRHSRLA